MPGACASTSVSISMWLAGRPPCSGNAWVCDKMPRVDGLLNRRSLLGHCMVNHTSSMPGVMGFGASAASPAPKAPAPKAQLLENFTHFQTSRKWACVLDFKVECDSRLPRMLFWMVFFNRPFAIRPWCPSNGILAWLSMLVHGVEKHRQAHTHTEATEAHTKPQKTTTTQRRTHHTAR